MGMPGGLEWVVILAVVFLLFGAKKLPELGGAIGESIRNFKKGLKEGEKEKELTAAERNVTNSTTTPSDKKDPTA